MNLQQLKQQIETNLKIKIDFRNDKYTPNSYDLSPVMDYTRAKSIINEAINILKIDIMHVNASIILHSMQTTILKVELEILLFNSREYS